MWNDYLNLFDILRFFFGFGELFSSLVQYIRLNGHLWFDESAAWLRPAEPNAQAEEEDDMEEAEEEYTDDEGPQDRF